METAKDTLFDMSFANRAAMIDFCHAEFGVKARKTLQQHPKTGSNFVKLLCTGCTSFVIYGINCNRGSGGKNDNSYSDKNTNEVGSFKCKEKSTNLFHTNCVSMEHRANKRELQCNPLLESTIANQNNRNKRNKLSYSTMRSNLEAYGVIASKSVIDKTVSSLTTDVKRDIYIEGYNKIIALLDLLVESNNGFQYDLEKWEGSNVLKRLAVVMPYCQYASLHNMNIYGVDAAHIKNMVVKNEDGILESMSKMQVYMISGRTGDNKSLIYAFGFAYTENMDDFKYFIDFVNNKGNLNINNSESVMVSDRSLSISAAIEACLPLASRLYCSVHLERNLKANKLSKGIPYYNTARQAKTLLEYETAMATMKENHLPSFEYLSRIDHWQQYKLIEKGVVLHGIQSSNVIESCFSWCLDAREHPPYQFISKLVVDIFEQINLQSGEIFKICNNPSIVERNTLITSYALSLFQASVFKGQKKVYNVKLFGESQGLVFSGNQALSAKKNLVNLVDKTCSCTVWQQTGVPCHHVLAFLKSQGKTILYNETFFNKILLTETLQQFYTLSCSSPYTFPGDSTIANRAYNDIEILKLYTPPKPKTEVRNLAVGTSQQRIRSTGDSGGSGGVIPAKAYNKKVNCPRCGKLLTRNWLKQHQKVACDFAKRLTNTVNYDDNLEVNLVDCNKENDDNF